MSALRATLMQRVRAGWPWAALGAVVAVPIAVAAASPLLAWRQPIYIAAGFAGIIALGLLLVQPILIGGFLPGLSALRARGAHRWVGALIVAAVLLHVVGLWITSPPDVIDALLFASPTPFSVWGVVAMWAVLITAVVAALRRPLRVRPRTWRIGHSVLAVVIVIGSVVHALLIEGTMGEISKIALCAFVIAAVVAALRDVRVRR